MLYKYRTIGNFKNLVDILLNQRLYAACYSELNDPVEGHYHSHLPDPARQVIEDIKLNKQALRICSLSKDPDHPLLWGHYADGRRGVVVGVEVEESDKCILKAIKYKSQLPRISESSSDRDTALKILSHKSSLWKHEGEYRAFLTDADGYASKWGLESEMTM